jgi:hypothetical protein
MLSGPYSPVGRLEKRKIFFQENEINHTQQEQPNTTVETFADHSLVKR